MVELRVLGALDLTGPFGLGWGLYLGLAFVFVFAIGVWVYRDAPGRGMNGMRWFLIVVLTGLIGLGLYLLLRRGHEATPT